MHQIALFLHKDKRRTCPRDPPPNKLEAFFRGCYYEHRYFQATFTLKVDSIHFKMNHFFQNFRGEHAPVPLPITNTAFFIVVALNTDIFKLFLP